MKTCIKCKLTKELTDFEKRPDSKDGYRKYCRSCKNSRQNERLKERKLKDDIFFWKSRAKSFNNPSGRRRGKAKDIILNSEVIEPEELSKLYNNNSKCHYCNVNLNKEDVHFDHSTPLSRKGLHSIDNLKVCCKDCNTLKGTRTEDEFKSFIKDYVSRFC